MNRRDPGRWVRRSALALGWVGLTCASWESQRDERAPAAGGGDRAGETNHGAAAGSAGHGLPCVAGGACRAPGDVCADSFGSSCTCVGPVGSSYFACAPEGGAGEGGRGGGIDLGSGGVSGASDSDDGAPRLCSGDAPWTTGAAHTKLVVDASKKQAAWNRFYERGVAADHANTVLSTAWGRNIQGALKKGHDQAGFGYARFHGILNDDIGVYAEDGDEPVYDWTRFDQVYDAVAEAGMRPIVEIGFMPPPLASDPTARLHWYNGVRANISPPSDWAKWRRFMAAIVQHLEARYGVDEVRDRWLFEVWNEPAWMYSLGEPGYAELYEQTVTGLLAGDPAIKVGGPAGSAESSLQQIPALVSLAEQKGLKLDFVSWHRYGNDGMQANYADANGMLTYFRRMGVVIKTSGFQGLSVNDEWGPSYDAASVRDSEVAASFIAKTVHLIGTDADYDPPFMFGYWTISDLYEEIDTGTALAYRQGNYGLLLKGDPRYPVSFDLEKPAFNAFRLLHLLGDVRVATSGGTTEDGVNAVATVSDDSGAVQVLVYNHVNGGTADSSTSELVTLTVSHLPFSADRVDVKHYLVDRSHSNSYRLWKEEMGARGQPTEAEWTQLRDAGRLCYYDGSGTKTAEGSYAVTYPQNVYGVSLFVLTPSAR